MSHRAATVVDVARKAGVSASTVSRVVRNSGHASSESTQSVLDAIQQLGYRPHRAARGLKYGRTFTIGIVMHDICNPFFSHAVKGAQQYLVSKGLDFELVLSNTSGETQRELRALELMVSKRVEGIILASTATQEAIELVREIVSEHAIPIVSIDNQLRGHEFAVVSAANREGAYQLTSHLLQHGHRRIGVISGPPHESHARMRLDGCIQAITERCPDLDQSLLVAVGNWTAEEGYAIARTWLDTEAPPAAIFCSNNFMCMGALLMLRERGLRVPEDVAVVSFDDVEFGDFLQPRLTTLRYSWNRIGEEAVRLALEAIETESTVSKPKQIDIPVQMLVRESCGCNSSCEVPPRKLNWAL